MQPQISRQYDSIIIVNELNVEKTGRHSSKLNYLPFANRAVNFDRPLLHCVHRTTPSPIFLFFWSLIRVDLSLFIRFFSLFFFSFAFSMRTASILPVIDNVFVIPQRAAGQREIRSAGKNDDRRKNPAPFPRGKSRREGEPLRSVVSWKLITRMIY